ncbi:hypothetical protein BaRGS_00035940 [Batillaria attramentaria]|uniref:Sulfotransferase n=2 Tax=Batillaria attramentaria TaxID=370345 RepID=A0ABD0JEH3_9CAEN
MGTRRIVVCVLVLLCGMLTYVGISWRSTTPANVLWNPLPVSSRFSRPVNLGVGQELPDQCKGPVGVPGAKPMKEYDLLQLGPFPFFNNFRNPCWYEENSSLGMSCLPYFYLAGFPKCGTTDLWNRICMHPDVARPAHKEPGWF